MTAHKLYWKVRDTMVAWGLLSRPRFYMRRHPAGTVRAQMAGRGSRRRIRCLSLSRLLDWKADR